MPLFQPLNPPISSFKGLRVWVVGASTGIGAATAGRLLALGAKVAVSARTAASLEAQFGAGAVVLPLDVTDAEATRRAAEKLVAEWGGVDLVLSVAGTYKAMRAWEIDLPEAGRIVDVNFTGVMNLFAAVRPTLMKQGAGGFGIVASVAGYGGLPNSLAYGASKAGVHALTYFLAKENAHHGITVNAVAPGPIATHMTRNFPQTLKNLIPVGRMGQPEDVADAVAFLAGDSAGFITGEVMDVNGGAWTD